MIWRHRGAKSIWLHHDLIEGMRGRIPNQAEKRGPTLPAVDSLNAAIARHTAVAIRNVDDIRQCPMEHPDLHACVPFTITTSQNGHILHHLWGDPVSKQCRPIISVRAALSGQLSHSPSRARGTNPMYRCHILDSRRWQHDLVSWHEAAWFAQPTSSYHSAEGLCYPGRSFVRNDHS
jgi:hypothetical protein